MFKDGMYGHGALPSRILMPRSREIESVNGVAGGFSETLRCISDLSLVSHPLCLADHRSLPQCFQIWHCCFPFLHFFFFFFLQGVAVLSAFINSLFDKGTEVWSVCMVRCVRLSVTPWIIAHQAPLSMGFSRQ